MLLTAEGWHSGNIRLLLDSQATLANVEAALLTLGRAADADDVCLVHFSGHGSKVADQEPLDEADGEDETLHCWDWRDLTDDAFGHLMNRFGTQQYVAALDCCHSGGQVASLSAAGGGNLRARFAPSQARLSEAAPDGLFADAWRPLMGQADLHDLRSGAVLAATSSSLLAYEYYSLEDGVFSHFLMQAMRGRAADKDADGALTCGELMDFASPRTTNYCSIYGKEQRPQAYYGAGMRGLELIGPLQTPDLMIASSEGVFEGNNIYSDGLHDQHAGQAVPPGKMRVFRVKLQNESRRVETYTLRGTGPTSTWKVKYALGGADVTSDMAGAGLIISAMPANSEKIITLAVGPKTADARVVRLAVTAEMERASSHRDTVTAEAWVEQPEAAAALVTSLLASETAQGSEISLHLAQDTNLDVRLVNIAGVPVRSLVTDRAYAAGAVRLAWDLRSDRGLRVPSGTYLVQVTARSPSGQQMRAMATLTVRR
jgi:hypothetical protein